MSTAANANLTGGTDSEAIERIGNQNDQLQGELHLAEREIATLKGEKGRLTREVTKLERSLETSQRELSEARANTEVQHDNYKLEREGLLNERKLLNETLLQTQRDLKQANLRANQEENQRDIWMKNANEAESKLGDLKWVQKILKDQEEALQDHVVINLLSQVRVDVLDTPYGPPRVRFGFRIRNESLFDITIHPKNVGGHVSFRERLLRETVGLDPNMESSVENVGHKEEGWIFLDQEFTASEIDRIKEALSSNSDGEFKFESVVIKVSGGKDFPSVPSQTLKIPPQMPVSN